MSNNSISIVGTVATEPRLVKTASGLQVCSFRLASGERRWRSGLADLHVDHPMAGALALHRLGQHLHGDEGGDGRTGGRLEGRHRGLRDRGRGGKL